ncbi:MAG: GNAT family N-acetyltransferase [Anaerolineae bacterium]|nr:GNAT family N-acetyltransferase [Anaerolineae bacterium]
MPDLLIKLYDVDPGWDFIREQASLGLAIRKPIGPEDGVIVDWVRATFNPGWASETARALANRPVSCFIATRDETVLGFACYDATALGMFGPIGVAETCRGQGTGRALYLACLLDMRLKGYAYAVVGGAGPVEFYRKASGAIVIPESEPGIYRGMLKHPGENA